MPTAADNPFRVSRIHALPFIFEREDWDIVLSRLEAGQRRGAIVGVHGHGKSTLLKEMEAHYQKEGQATALYFFNDSRRRLTKSLKAEIGEAIAAGKMLFVDGAEQLPILQWRWLKRQSRTAGGLVITTHITGMLPTIHECRTSPELLQSLVIQLVPEHAEALQDTAFRLYEAHLGDLRKVFFGLYDLYAQDAAAIHATTAPPDALTKT